MNAFNRAFTNREIAVILVLTLVLLALVFYRFVYAPMQEQLERCR